MQEGFCHSDLWAAEAYLTALDAGEPEFLDMLDKGIKIHNWLFDIVMEKFPEAAAQAKFTYHKAKQLIHAMNYGVETKRMAQESGLPEVICSWIHNMYHSKFPGIRMRMYRIQEELKKSQSLTNLFGRKRIFFAPWGNDLFKEAYAWPSQSMIGELANLAMNKLLLWGKRNNPWMLPALNTHDGIIIRYYLGEEDKVREKVAKAFRVPLTQHGRTVSIPVEIGFGMNFNSVKGKQVLR